jgi:hypothetical protein
MSITFTIRRVNALLLCLFPQSWGVHVGYSAITRLPPQDTEICYETRRSREYATGLAGQAPQLELDETSGTSS